MSSQPFGKVISSARAFAERLTADLQAVSKDKHLRVRYSHNPIPVRKERSEPTAAEKEQGQWMNKRINFGFERVERMNGNIGYIDLRNFNDHEAGAETVAAAMGFLANTEALIFDPVTPIVIDRFMGDRAAPLLARLRGWMTRETSVIIGVICLLIGAKLIGDALGAL